MDLRYSNALRNATNAWSKNRMTDPMTMQDLTRRAHLQEQGNQPVTTTPNAAQTALLQPELARFGHLGTKLNLFA